MHAEAINKETKRVLEKVAKCSFVKRFYLAGGTTLAMHLGHRESIDLDFFSTDMLFATDIKKELSEIGSYTVIHEDKQTLDGFLDDTKISFFYYHYKQLFPFIDCCGVMLADERDIAAMKIDAISSRGSKKDFIDLYFLLEKYTLPELIGFFEKKYSGIAYNKLHILKSLVFFDDAEQEPAPRMIKKIEWDTVKAKIIQEVKKLQPI